MTTVANPTQSTPGSEEAVYAILTRICGVLDVSMDRSQLVLADLPHDPEDRLTLLAAAGKHFGVMLKQFEFDGLDGTWDLVTEGYPVVLSSSDSTLVVEKRVSGKAEVSRIDNETGETRIETVSRRQLVGMVREAGSVRAFVAKEELECSHLSAADAHDHGDHDTSGDHVHRYHSPLRRFMGLLRLDRRDIGTVALFALVAGILSLATPLAIESLVNVVSWGTYWQPLLVLATMLLACLGLSGLLRVLQTCLVEIIQRRQLVRIVGDLAHRFPRANQASLAGEYPRELANRLFDIMTIQKATSVLLLDGVSLVLTTALGMALLAFYHPFLLGFDLVLLISMISLTWLLGRGGIRTAIEESMTKYRIVHWLQDVLASPGAFKVNGGESLAIDRANRLASDYIRARKRQFHVIIRQVTFAVGLQVVASTILLGLGGWLVIQQQLTLGQLVASELVVTVVVGSFAKAGKSIEKFYDLMAGVEKVGHLLDIPVDPRRQQEVGSDRQGEIWWDDLSIHDPAGAVRVPALRIKAGSRVAVVGEDSHAKSLLLRVLAGLSKASKGMAEVAGVDARFAGIASAGRIVGYAGPVEVFNGTLVENVSLGRTGVGRNRVRDVLQQLGLWSNVLRLPEGGGTMLQTGGYPLNRSEVAVLMIARAIAAHPSVVLIDGLLDDLPEEWFDQVWETLANPAEPWTVLVATKSHRVISRCNDQIAVRANHD